MKIDPTAFISPGVSIGKDVIIGPYACIQSPYVVLRDRVRIESHAYIEGKVDIGEDSIVRSFAVIGTKAQICKNNERQSHIHIGKYCDIGEYVTIHSSRDEKGSVSIGNHCHLMPYVHIAHDCILGYCVILGKGVQLAGHVTIGNEVVVDDCVPVHQFCRIGSLAVVKEMTRGVTFDVPPYTCGGGFPYLFEGINAEYLQQRGLSKNVCSELQRAIHALYYNSWSTNEALLWVENNLHPFPEISTLVEFCRSSKRGLIGLRSEIL